MKIHEDEIVGSFATFIHCVLTIMSDVVVLITQTTHNLLHHFKVHGVVITNQEIVE